MLLLCLLALAAQRQDAPLSLLGRYELACPVCEQRFTTVACVQTNTRGGIDRDLFARAIGAQPEFYRISTCPACGYSGYEVDFADGVSIPQDVRERILKNLRAQVPAGFKPTSDPRELDAADRYRLAITCYEWRAKSDEALAWLYLRASWIAREEGSSLPREDRLARVMKYIERYRPAADSIANQYDIEMQTAARIAEALAAGAFTRYQRPYVELALALILRRHGENRQAAPLLEALPGPGTFSTELLEAVTRMRESIRQERELQAKAAAAFERALLAEQIQPPNRGPAMYLMGELLRRLGRDQEAVRWFRRAAAEPGLPAELKSWTLQQQAWATAPAP